MSIYDRDLLTGRNKVETAIERIRTFCAGKKVLVAFSGGKDSQCCYHLAKLAGFPFDAQYSVTRFEPPELIAFVRQHYPEVTFRRAYIMPLVNEIAQKGMPNRWFRYCCKCKHCKTDGYDIAIIGIRSAESARRRSRWTMFGQKQDKSYYVCPICDWSDADVWEFLNSYKIPHCCLYDEGYLRIGCVCCPLAPASNARDIARYPKFVAMLKVGFMKYLERNDIKSAKTNELIAKYRTDPDRYFGNWLKYGTTEGKKIDDEPCLFAGTGFSESDGANIESEEGSVK